MTRLFLTKIPFFREVIVSSFSCDHCGYKDSELQQAGRIQDKGVKYCVQIVTQKVFAINHKHEQNNLLCGMINQIIYLIVSSFTVHNQVLKVLVSV